VSLSAPPSIESPIPKSPPKSNVSLPKPPETVSSPVPGSMLSSPQPVTSTSSPAPPMTVMAASVSEAALKVRDPPLTSAVPSTSSDWPEARLASSKVRS